MMLSTTASFVTALLLVLDIRCTHSFTTINNNNHASSTTTRRYLSSPAELSEYMAKAHEEKLRALKDIEDKKAAEINALKNEIAELKGSGGSSTSAIEPVPKNAVTEESKEELAAKLLQYQQFMAKYIVEAQEQKVAAVKAAEAAVTKKYEDKLLLLGGSSGTEAAAPAAPAVATPTTKEEKLYMERNAAVTAAAAAGKSRWGDKEVQRLQTTTATAISGSSSTPVAAAPAPAAVEVATPAVPVPVPPEVEAADHGLRADGGVGGLTLAERIAFGANAASSSTSTAAVAAAAVSNGAAAPATIQQQSTVLYNIRNQQVVESAKAGKSRWGEMEIQKATKMVADAAATLPTATTSSPPAATTTTTPKATGGISPSLSERVNFGAQFAIGG